MKTRFVIVMGVAGCGKTTVGESLAKRLGWQFCHADAFHPAENLAKDVSMLVNEIVERIISRILS